MSGPARRFLAWAEDNIREAQAYGAQLDLFIMPVDAELMLLTAATREGLAPSEYRIDETGTWLAGVKVLWTNKLNGQIAWFRYKGGKA